ncbi:Uncharacterized protein Rs2_11885 [Raphanus sativus]|nr:hypothetical protein Rs2_48709 [Raphanus sativus]KAJ4889562.1 Uncharacterized protein Rs2_29310 [Raphanus sativus]KAJ4908227.1 Uncharacterized protein Rs2_11885 [Raphanus sativus]
MRIIQTYRFCGGGAGSSSTTSKYGGVKTRRLIATFSTQPRLYIHLASPLLRLYQAEAVESICKAEVADIDKDGAISPVISARTNCFIDSHLTIVYLKYRLHTLS